MRVRGPASSPYGRALPPGGRSFLPRRFGAGDEGARQPGGGGSGSAPGIGEAAQRKGREVCAHPGEILGVGYAAPLQELQTLGASDPSVVGVAGAGLFLRHVRSWRTRQSTTRSSRSSSRLTATRRVIRSSGSAPVVQSSTTEPSGHFRRKRPTRPRPTGSRNRFYSARRHPRGP